jgi:hypothetical protein
MLCENLLQGKEILHAVFSVHWLLTCRDARTSLHSSLSSSGKSHNSCRMMAYPSAISDIVSEGFDENAEVAFDFFNPFHAHKCTYL